MKKQKKAAPVANIPPGVRERLGRGVRHQSAKDYDRRAMKRATREAF